MSFIPQRIQSLLSWFHYRIAVPVTRIDSLAQLNNDAIQCAIDNTKTKSTYQLVLTPSQKKILAGFYFFELSTARYGFFDNFQILLAYKDGSIESTYLRLQDLDTTKRLLWIHEGLSSITLHSSLPFDEGALSAQLTKVSQSFANNKINHKLKVKSEIAVRQLQAMSLLERWQQYNDLFPAHNHQSNYQHWMQHQEPTLWLTDTPASMTFTVFLLVTSEQAQHNAIDVARQVKHLSPQSSVVVLSTLPSQTQSDQTLTDIEYLTLPSIAPHVLAAHSDNRAHEMAPEATSKTIPETKPEKPEAKLEEIITQLNAYLLTHQPPHCVFLNVSQPLTLSDYFFVELSAHLCATSQAEVVYFDEDVMYQSLRCQPIFKTKLNIDLLYSHNYIGNHCYIAYESLLNNSGFVGFDAQAADSFLYAHYLKVSQLRPQQIHHIAKVLIHNHLTAKVEATTKQSAAAESSVFYNLHHGSRDSACLQSFLDAYYPDAQAASGLLEGTHHVIWSLLASLPMVSIIIPTKDNIALLDAAIQSVLTRTDYPSFEIIVVNNNSELPESLAYFAQLITHAKITVLEHPHPFNFSEINNMAVQHAQGEVLLFLNNDVEVINKGWLTELVRHAHRDDIGCVGAKLYYKNEQIQHAGVIMGIGDVAEHSHRFYHKDEIGYHGRLMLVQNYAAVTGACLAIRKQTFFEIGQFNATDLAVAYNDVDLCLKALQRGYRNVWTPYAELYHYESISRGKDTTPEKKARQQKEIHYMRHTWSEYIRRDPYHNPNFKADKENFTY